MNALDKVLMILAAFGADRLVEGIAELIAEVAR